MIPNSDGKSGKIYLPTIPNKDLGVVWLAHEISNLSRVNQYYEVDKQLTSQLASNDPKTKVMAPDEFVTKKINIETSSIIDRARS